MFSDEQLTMVQVAQKGRRETDPERAEDACHPSASGGAQVEEEAPV